MKKNLAMKKIFSDLNPTVDTFPLEHDNSWCKLKKRKNILNFYTDIFLNSVSTQMYLLF